MTDERILEIYRAFLKALAEGEAVQRFPFGFARALLKAAGLSAEDAYAAGASNAADRAAEMLFGHNGRCPMERNGEVDCTDCPISPVMGVGCSECRFSAAVFDAAEIHRKKHA